MAVACTCEQCGKGFIVKHSVIKYGGGKFCSRKCYVMSCGERRVDRICGTCGITFTIAISSAKNGRKFCSKECYANRERSFAQCVCEICGNTFRLKVSEVQRGRGRYCSSKCYGVSRSEKYCGKNNHQWRGGHAVYRGENWNSQRELAYIRDQGVCKQCGKKAKKGQRKFAVHHVRPYRDFNGDWLAANQLTNLITLCHHCHPNAEHGKIAVQPYLL